MLNSKRSTWSIFIVREEYVFFKSNLTCQNQPYEAVTPYPQDLVKSAIVVQGVVASIPFPSSTTWKAAISAQKLGVILAGAADHRQYPNPDEDQRIEELEDEEFKTYREVARANGYALENPSTFFIQHVFPTTVQKLPQITLKVRLAERMIQSFLPQRSIAEWPQRVVTQIMGYLEEEI